MPKHKRWNGESGVIYLRPNWKKEMINAFTKYNMPYKQRVKNLEKALLQGLAVVK